MTNETLSTKLLALGFQEGERDPKNPENYADLGTPVTGLWYGYRVHQGQWQYVSLCSHLGRFVEAVVIVYQTRFNSRQKSQQSPLFATLVRSLTPSPLCRSFTDLSEVLSKKYDLPKKA